MLGQKVQPLDRVGLYVPGGKAAYPSSVLMNAVPARVAGVPRLVVCVPAPEGVLNPLVLAAAHVAGVTRAFTIGGAQAIGALMNARGLMELILINIGLQAGVIEPGLFSILVLMAIVTTLMATPLFNWIMRRRAGPSTMESVSGAG